MCYLCVEVNPSQQLSPAQLLAHPSYWDVGTSGRVKLRKLMD